MKCRIRWENINFDDIGTLNPSTSKYLSLDNGVTMTSKRRENINLVSFICLSFLVISLSKQLLIKL